jgi:DNA-binding transcriptional regulator YiaG
MKGAKIGKTARAIARPRSLRGTSAVRTVEVPAAPSNYGAVTVRSTRHKIGVSQALFAQLLGVSTVLVRAWEQGQRAPAVWARRLLDEVNRDPRHWRQMLRKAS